MTEFDPGNLPKVLSVLELLTEEELVQLNHVIVARIRLMQQIRSHGQMMNFRIGQTVRFTSPAGHAVRGVVKSHNRKTVTIISDDGLQWLVSPHLLHGD